MTHNAFPLNPNRSLDLTEKSHNFFSLKDINELFDTSETQKLFNNCRGANDQLATQILRQVFKKDKVDVLERFIKEGLNVHARLVDPQPDTDGRGTLEVACVYSGATKCLQLLAPMVDLTQALESSFALELLDCSRILLGHTRELPKFSGFKEINLRNVLVRGKASEYFDLCFEYGLTAAHLALEDKYGYSIFCDMTTAAFSQEAEIAQGIEDGLLTAQDNDSPLALIHKIVLSYPNQPDLDTLEAALKPLKEPGSYQSEYDNNHHALISFIQSVREKVMLGVAIENEHSTTPKKVLKL